MNPLLSAARVKRVLFTIVSGTMAVAIGVTLFREPQLELLTPRSTDMGTLTVGESRSYDFRLSNAGPGVLKLGTPVPGCGCTLASLSKQELRKGETAILRMTVETADSQGRAAVGDGDPIQLTETVRLGTNDRQHSELLFEASVRLAPEFLLSRQSVSFPLSDDGEKAAQEVRVQELGSARITGAVTEEQWLSVEVIRKRNQSAVIRLIEKYSSLQERVALVRLQSSSRWNPHLSILVTTQSH